jgi:hypothetical protein
MTRTDLHELLSGTLKLVPDPVQRGDSLTYFVGEVQRHPARCTYAVRVLYDPCGEPSRLQLCASSDNNDTVLLQAPFNERDLLALVQTEIAIVKERLRMQGECGAA